MINRLDVRIILSLTLILAAMIAAYGGFIGKRQSEMVVRTLTDNLTVLSRSTADNAAHFMVVQDYAGLDEHMLEAALLPDVLDILIIETDGTVICNIKRPSLQEKPKLLTHNDKVSPPSGAGTELKRGEQLVTSWTPITAGTQLGWLKMTLSLHGANELQRSTWLGALVIGMIWILIGTGLMVLVVRRPLRAIRELSRFVHDLQDRKGAQVTVSRGVREIDLLADALNHSSLELQAAEQQLVAEQERLSVTLQSIGDGVIATDTGFRIVLFNQVAERLTGWSQDEVLGRPLDDIVQLEGDPALNHEGNPLATVLSEKRMVELADQIRLVSHNGMERAVTVNGAPIIDRLGTLAGMVLVIRDITEKTEMEHEKKKLEEQLIQSQKMESIGQLAGGIAHDFNNILTAIFGYTELLRRRLKDDTEFSIFADQLFESANRAANLTRSLLSFSRKQTIELKPADINIIVNGVQKLLSRLIGEDIRLTAKLTSGNLPAMVDSGQLEQILMNLTTNARDAMPNGGELTIATEEVYVDNLYSGSVPGSTPGRYALISVSDTGTGMDQQTCSRIFEPFFTTKKIGQGTGLGLSIVYGIIRQHHGFVKVYSEPGHGTIFRLYLPLLEGCSIEKSQEPVHEERHGTETILLVEDDRDVRTILALSLREAGYTIVEANCGQEAIELFDRHLAQIDLILMDVIMPDMNGKEAYTRICRCHPTPRVIFMSGYTADVFQNKGILDDVIDYIHKPVSKQQLLNKVRDVLDSDPESTHPGPVQTHLHSGTNRP